MRTTDDDEEDEDAKQERDAAKEQSKALAADWAAMSAASTHDIAVGLQWSLFNEKESSVKAKEELLTEMRKMRRSTGRLSS
jgi:hypothetical protein